MVGSSPSSRTASSLLMGGDRRSSRPRGAPPRPCARPTSGRAGPADAGLRARDRVEHLEFGAVQVRHDRDARHDRAAASWIGVRWCRWKTCARRQVSGSGDQSRPRGDHPLALLGRHPRERPVGHALALLVGRVHRERRIHRVRSALPARHGLVVGDGHRVDAGEERRRVAERALGAQRPAGQRHVPAASDQRARQVRGDERRSAARVEQQAHRNRVVVARQARQPTPCRSAPPSQPESASSSRRSARRRSRAIRAIDDSSWRTSGSDGSGRTT